jgi:hypothetical protein
LQIGRGDGSVGTVAVWDDLKRELDDLREHHPGALRGWPMTTVDEGRQPPFWIDFAPWAASLAERLHERFGDAVQLRVGYFRCPGPILEPRIAAAIDRLPGLLSEPDWLGTSLDVPVVVRTGRSLSTTVRFTNRSEEPKTVRGGGALTTYLVDPISGVIVGGYSGAVAAIAGHFEIPANDSCPIPVLIGADSLVPALGHTVPPGQWSLVATFTEGPLGPDSFLGGSHRTPRLPIVVVP